MLRSKAEVEPSPARACQLRSGVGSSRPSTGKAEMHSTLLSDFLKKEQVMRKSRLLASMFTRLAMDSRTEQRSQSSCRAENLY